jgi:hypothetical protein
VNHWKSTAFSVARRTGLGLFAAALGAAAPGFAQVDAGFPADGSAPCPAGDFDICFPDLSMGAPNATCDGPADGGAAVANDCLSRVCAGAGTEPQPGFFEHCCALGGSERYDDFCVYVVQSECSAVADLCLDRCPPLALLTGTVPMAPLPVACLADYPAFVTRVCEMDPFCCTTSWDSICVAEAEAEAASGL